MPQKIEIQSELLVNSHKIDAVYCGNIKKSDSFSVEEKPFLRGDIFPEVLDTPPNAIHTLLIKKNIVSQIGGFDTSLCTYEELDFWIRLSEVCNFDYIPKCLAIYHVHGRQVSANLKMKISGREALLRKHEKNYSQNKKYLYWHLRKLASRYALLGEYSQFWNYIFKAISIKPFIFGSYVHVILAIFCKPLHKKIICRYGLKKFGDILLV